MPQLDGLKTLEKIREMKRPPLVVIVTAHGSEKIAVEAMKKGAYDYIAKPYEMEELRIITRNALEKIALQEENTRLRMEIGMLEGYLLHYTHRDLKSMVEKTMEWSKVEAELRYKSGHPKITWWRFPRVMLTAFFDSYIRQGGWKAGAVGLIESMYQSFSIFVTYARLWEMQQEKK